MATVGSGELGRFGVWTFDFESLPASGIRDAVQEIEELGWPAVWIPELLGRDAFSHAGFLLASTSRIRVVNGIASIWAREAQWAHGASVLLADAYPGRHIVGFGYGGAKKEGVSPLAAMTSYLDAIDAIDADGGPNPEPASPIRRLLAAYGPAMLQLAKDRAAGAHTYKVNIDHTARTREILGPDRFLGVEHAVLLETQASIARTVARQHLAPYLAGAFNVAKFKRLGYSDEDLADGGSDRFVDDFVFWGSVEDVVAKLHGHIERGADHVGVQVIGIEPGESGLPAWRELATALF